MIASIRLYHAPADSLMCFPFVSWSMELAFSRFYDTFVKLWWESFWSLNGSEWFREINIMRRERSITFGGDTVDKLKKCSRDHLICKCSAPFATREKHMDNLQPPDNEIIYKSSETEIIWIDILGVPLNFLRVIMESSSSSISKSCKLFPGFQWFPLVFGFPETWNLGTSKPTK